MQHFDMVIVGGGMVGLALASALADTDIRIAIINSRALKAELSKQPELRAVSYTHLTLPTIYSV